MAAFSVTYFARKINHNEKNIELKRLSPINFGKADEKRGNQAVNEPSVQWSNEIRVWTQMKFARRLHCSQSCIPNPFLKLKLIDQTYLYIAVFHTWWYQHNTTVFEARCNSSKFEILWIHRYGIFGKYTTIRHKLCTRNVLIGTELPSVFECHKHSNAFGIYGEKSKI